MLTFLTSFLASSVECIEAMTVILAVGAVRGWRGAFGGAAGALAVLAALIAILGPTLTRLPPRPLQLVLGALVLLFGMRWLRKAILRSAGILALHDERAAYARETGSLRAQPAGIAAWDRVALATAFQITMVEGIEVVFIVTAIGAGAGRLAPAAAGAGAALLLVMALGAALHRPIATVPENALKFAVGVLLCGFGTFWAGEGMGLSWPGGDAALPGVTLGFLAVALAARAAARAKAHAHATAPLA